LRVYFQAVPNPARFPPWVAELVRPRGGEMGVPWATSPTNKSLDSNPDIILLAWAAAGDRANPPGAYADRVGARCRDSQTAASFVVRVNFSPRPRPSHSGLKNWPALFAIPATIRKTIVESCRRRRPNRASRSPKFSSAWLRKRDFLSMKWEFSRLPNGIGRRCGIALPLANFAEELRVHARQIIRTLARSNTISGPQSLYDILRILFSRRSNRHDAVNPSPLRNRSPGFFPSNSPSIHFRAANNTQSPNSPPPHQPAETA